MANYIITRTFPDELAHHGVKGQKWGVRRYQNEDGTLTKKGMKERAKIEKWYNSGTGKRDIARTHKAGNWGGLSKTDAYLNRKNKKSMITGWLVGGILGAAISSAVTTKRTESGRAFFENEIARLDNK